MPSADSRFGTQKLYGANFSYAAHPSRLVRGTVVDKETKKPLAGVQVDVAHTNTPTEILELRYGQPLPSPGELLARTENLPSVPPRTFPTR